MTFEETVKNRYSCRKYSDKPVERELVEDIMQSARIAPSACNAQRWMFIAVDDKDKISKLADIMRNDEWKINGYAADVPVYIALVNHPVRNPSKSQQSLLGDTGAGWSDLDLGIAAEQIMLSATSKGLGNVAIGWFDQAKAGEILDLPKDMTVSLFIGMGYPSEDKTRKHVRLPREEVFRFNSYNNTEW